MIPTEDVPGTTAATMKAAAVPVGAEEWAGKADPKAGAQDMMEQKKAGAQDMMELKKADAQAMMEPRKADAQEAAARAALVALEAAALPVIPRAANTAALDSTSL